MPFDPLYTVAEAAKLLKVSPDWVYDRIGEGRIGVVELGTTRKNQRIRESELQRFVDARSFEAVT